MPGYALCQNYANYALLNYAPGGGARKQKKILPIMPRRQWVSSPRPPRPNLRAPTNEISADQSHDFHPELTVYNV